MAHYLPLALLVSGFLITPSSSYRNYNFVNLKKTWAEAQRYCRERFTDLATMENKSTIPKLQSAPPDGTAKAWIGLFSNTSKWWWSVDNTKDALFYNWDAKQPDNDNENRLCVIMGRNGKWKDVSCSAKKPFLCFTKPASENMTYHLKTKKMEWLAARDYCRKKGMGDLAFITTPSENQAAQKLVKDSTWIGLRRYQWVWSGYAVRPFKNWGSDDSTSDANLCVAVHFPSAKWYKYGCTRKLPFICNEGPKTTYLKMKLQADVNLTDPDIYSPLLQQLHTALGKGVENFKLHWSSPPERPEEEEDRNEPGLR